MTIGTALAMVYCGAAFGGSFLFMRVAAPDLPAPLFAFLRVGIGSLLILVVGGSGLLASCRRDWRGFAVLGVFMTGGPFLLFAAAEETITAGLGAVINATTPMWTVLILAAWMRQAPTAMRIAAVVVGFTGVAVIVGIDGLRIAPDAWVGVALATAAAASYGIGLTYIRRNMAGHEPMALAFGMLAAASVLLLPLALLTAGQAQPTLPSIAAVLGIATVSTAIAMPLLFQINHRVGPVATSTVTFINPIFGVLWGAVFLHEAVTPTLLGGGLLVFVALAMILNVRPGRLRRSPAS